MDAMIANIDGEMKKELINIMTFGMILFFTSKRYEKFVLEQVKTKKVSINIFKNILYLKKKIIIQDQFI
jgi:hypothetical protein